MILLHSPLAHFGMLAAPKTSMQKWSFPMRDTRYSSTTVQEQYTLTIGHGHVSGRQPDIYLNISNMPKFG